MMRCQLIIGGQKTLHFCHDRMAAALLKEVVCNIGVHKAIILFIYAKIFINGKCDKLK
jgi:hypothetical protein